MESTAAARKPIWKARSHIGDGISATRSDVSALRRASSSANSRLNRT